MNDKQSKTIRSLKESERDLQHELVRTTVVNVKEGINIRLMYLNHAIEDLANFYKLKEIIEE